MGISLFYTTIAILAGVVKNIDKKRTAFPSLRDAARTERFANAQRLVREERLRAASR